MTRLLSLALALAALACSDPSGPSGLTGQWTNNPVETSGGNLSVSAVIAENGGVLNGSGVLTLSGCFGSPYAVTLTGARAGADVSFTLLPGDVNFTGTYRGNTITGTLTGVKCGGIPIFPLPSITLQR